MHAELGSLLEHHTRMLSCRFRLLDFMVSLGFEELWFFNFGNPNSRYLTLPPTPTHTHSQAPLRPWVSPLLAGRSDRACEGPFPPN